MATHYRCGSLSDQQVIECAQALRDHHGLGDAEAPNVIDILGRDTILTRSGTKAFRYRIAKDAELGADEAITNISPVDIEVVLSKTTYFRALVGDGRARMTIAHELAHAALHSNSAPLARAKLGDGRTFLKPSEDVEHQAKVFASHYLMPEAAVLASTHAADLARRSCVSLQAAQIRWQKAKNGLTGLKSRQCFWLSATNFAPDRGRPEARSAQSAFARRAVSRRSATRVLNPTVRHAIG